MEPAESRAAIQVPRRSLSRFCHFTRQTIQRHEGGRRDSWRVRHCAAVNRPVTRGEPTLPDSVHRSHKSGHREFTTGRFPSSFPPCGLRSTMDSINRAVSNLLASCLSISLAVLDD